MRKYKYVYVKFENNPKEYCYAANGFVVNPGDLVMVGGRGQGRNIVTVTRSSDLAPRGIAVTQAIIGKKLPVAMPVAVARPQPVTRKVIQITTSGITTIMFALCDDGTMWQKNYCQDKWTQIQVIPGCTK